MLEWQATGFVLSAKRFGESGAIVDLFTREFGRCKGLVRGGSGKKMRPLLQSGNVLNAVWRARLSDHLGHFTVEPENLIAGRYLDSPSALNAILSLTELLMVTPERQAYPRLYDTAQLVLSHLDDFQTWPALMVRFEMALLSEMGFGLDLSRCAATGQTSDLTFVSPKSGCAVSTSAATPYQDRLFALPRFLKDVSAEPNVDDIVAGFVLSGHFLDRRVLLPNGHSMPEVRSRMTAYFRNLVETERQNLAIKQDD